MLCVLGVLRTALLTWLKRKSVSMLCFLSMSPIHCKRCVVVTVIHRNACCSFVPFLTLSIRIQTLLRGDLDLFSKVAGE